MARSIFNAYYWNMGGKFIVRFLGLISSLILVRLLTPSDFGIIAMTMLFVGFFDMLSEAGINRYLMLQKIVSTDVYNQAWTLNIFLKGSALLLLFMLSNQIAVYTNSNDLSLTLKLLVAIQFIILFKNVGLIKYERELNYEVSNRILITAKFFSFFATIGFATYLADFRALLIGLAVNSIIILILSYTWVEMRPRFDFTLRAEMLKFSSQIYIRNLLGFVRSKADVIFVGRFYGEAAMGKFKVSDDFSLMPFTELLMPAFSPLFAAMSQIKHDRELLFKKFYQLNFLGSILLLPSAVGLYIVSEDFAAVVLGENWLEVSDIIKYLGIFSFMMFTQCLLFILYDTQGKIEQSITHELISIVLFVSFVLILMPKSIFDYAQIKFMSGLLIILAVIFYGHYVLGFKLYMYLLAVIPSILPITVMWYVCSIVQPELTSPAIRLFGTSLVGLITYSIVLMLITTILYKTTSVYKEIVPYFIVYRINKLRYRRRFS